MAGMIALSAQPDDVTFCENSGHLQPQPGIERGRHTDVGQIQFANLLLNTGPLPDGSIHPDDVATLREMGFQRAIALDGGVKAWREAGYRVESES